MNGKSDNLIVNLTFEFSLGIMEFADLLESKKKFVFANQVLKSGCSIGANVREAQNAEGKSGFIHKMKIAAKEAEETHYWLSLSQAAPKYPNCEELLVQIASVLKILGKIISTSKNDIK